MRFPFLTILPLLLTACPKPYTPPPDNPYGLPNATQTGADVFACRINGVNWIVDDDSMVYRYPSFSVGTSFSKSNVRTSFSIGASGSIEAAIGAMGFVVNQPIQQGATYRLNDTTKAYASAMSFFATCGPVSGYGNAQWNTSADGSLTITHFSGTYTVPSCCTYGTYDANAIVSGTFWFYIVPPGCDTIQVTDGRFDINYSQY